jgi:hypothetical protein
MVVTQEMMVSRRCPATVDKQRDQPLDSNQVMKPREKLLQAEGWQQRQSLQ